MSAPRAIHRRSRVAARTESCASGTARAAGSSERRSTAAAAQRSSSLTAAPSSAWHPTAPACCRRSTACSARTARSCFRTHAVAGSTSAASGAGTGSRLSEPPDRAVARSLRPAPHLRHLRAPRRRAGVRGLPFHRLEHRHDRSPLRPPRPRQPRTRRLPSRRARARESGGRCVDVDPTGLEACHGQRFKAEAEGIQHSGGRSVDVAARTRRHPSLRKGLICRENAKPSDGLEPSTPSLPWRCSTN